MIRSTTAAAIRICAGAGAVRAGPYELTAVHD